MIYVDGGLVVSNDHLGSTERASGFVALSPGLHDLRIEYFFRGGASGGASTLQLLISGPGLTLQTVPAARMFLPQGGSGLSQCGDARARSLPDGRVLCFGHPSQANFDGGVSNVFSEHYPPNGRSPSSGCGGDVCAGPQFDAHVFQKPYGNSSLIGFRPPFLPQ